MATTRTSLIIAATLALGLGGALAGAATRSQVAPTAPQTRTVVAGFGDQGGAANVFAPRTIDIYTGDTVTWRVGGALEPHTITFGSPTLLKGLSANQLQPLPQKSGPPQLAFNPGVAFPTARSTYDGTGYANSGLLVKGQSYSLAFTKPGTYRFYCLIHYPAMSGMVVVHPRPGQARLYHVLAGDSMEQTSGDASAVTDQFFPRHLTIHAGDTVSWVGGFHTVTFGPDAVRTELEHHLILPSKSTDGKTALVFNPRVAFPSGGASYDGTGFANSGLLFMRAGKNTPPEYHLTFTKPGTYEYDCLMHPGMDGAITVLPRGA